MLLYKLLKIRVVLFVIFPDIIVGQETLTINTKLGKITGIEEQAIISNYIYFRFGRIPYAEPRIAEQRFDSPKLNNKTWSGTFNGTNDLTLCPQYRYDNERLWRGNDDCLHMNIYTPCVELRNQCNINNKYPVIVFIGGGGFVTGVADYTNLLPDYLIPHGVVIVTFHYRLGPFGFLNMYTKNALGNNGMKDQVVALQWVKENIADYCGDPNQVTLLGYGAGAEMIKYHTFTPLSKGLFHKIIQESPYGTQRAIVLKPKEAAFALGQELGINTTDPDVLLNELRKIPSKKIVNAAVSVNLLRFDPNDNVNAWAPSVEAPIEGLENERFLVDFPYTTITDGPIYDVPTLVGTNLDEGRIYVAPNFFNSTPEWVKNNIERFLPMSLNITNPQKRADVINKMIQFYFYNNGVFNNSNENVAQLYSDSWYHIPTHINARITAARQQSKVFKYLYSYKSVDSFFRKRYPSGKSAAHFDELEYVWYVKPFAEIPQPNSDKMALMQAFSKMWTNFVKYGNPVQKMEIGVPVDTWNPITEDNFLEINYENKTTLTNRNGFLRDKMRFWVRNIYNDALRDVKQYFSDYFDDEDDDSTNDRKYHSLR